MMMLKRPFQWRKTDGMMGHMVLMRAVGDWSLSTKHRVLYGFIVSLYIIWSYLSRLKLFLELVDMWIAF